MSDDNAVDQPRLEIEYHSAPKSVLLGSKDSVTVSGEKFNEMQEALRKAEFLERVVSSKVTIFEKDKRQIISGEEAYSFLAYGKDEIVVKYTEAMNDINRLRSNLETANERNKRWEVTLSEARGDVQKLENAYSKLARRGFFKRLFNTGVLSEFDRRYL